MVKLVRWFLSTTPISIINCEEYTQKHFMIYYLRLLPESISANDKDEVSNHNL